MTSERAEKWASFQAAVAAVAKELRSEKFSCFQDGNVFTAHIAAEGFWEQRNIEDTIRPVAYDVNLSMDCHTDTVGVMVEHQWGNTQTGDTRLSHIHCEGSDRIQALAKSIGVDISG